MLREARGGLKATVGNRVKPDHHFIRIVFCYFPFLSARLLLDTATWPCQVKECKIILGAKSANWLTGCVVNLVSNFMKSKL